MNRLVSASAVLAACLSQTARAAPFRRFRASPAVGPWRRPDVRRGGARLRPEAAGPPEIACAYRLVRIGCGAGSIIPAFANRKTGHVTFAPAGAK